MKNEVSDTALIVVDVQNDFCPGGALPVPNGSEVVVPLNRLMEEVAGKGGLIVISRDWHPHNSEHFNRWPVHCVQNTAGARFHPLLKIPSGAIHIYKGRVYYGTEKEVDGYSVFDGMTWGRFTLEEILRAKGGRIRHVLVGGLATDYCVKKTVLDACLLGFQIGFRVSVELYACRGLADDTTREAIRAMYHAGARLNKVPIIRQGR